MFPLPKTQNDRLSSQRGTHLSIALFVSFSWFVFSWATLPAFGQQQAQQNRNRDIESQTKIQIRLKTLTAESLHARLEKVLRRQLATSQDPSGKWLGFNIDQAEGVPLTIWANSEAKMAQLSGPAKLVGSWQRVITTLDTPLDKESTLQFVATQPDSKAKVQQAVNAVEAAGAGVEGTQDLPALRTPNNGAGQDSVGLSLLGPVQIDTVEGTDIMLLRGNARDVQRVLDVINQIEEMTDVGDPEIKIVKLKHVVAEDLATLMTQIFTDTSQKYGSSSPSIYPLSRPNAVLLVALPQTMQRAEDIIARLDQPGEEASQFETIPLKHAKAEDAREIVSDLFIATPAEDGTTTLAPKAQVIADSRTNSLIVRASPRDLTEVRALVAKIDQLGSQSVNDLRVFKLKSSVASDLESVLRDAFSSGQNSNDPNSQLSRLLRLVTIDAAGQRQLQSGVLADAEITSSASANALIITAPEESMPLLEALIAQLDQAPDAAIELKIFPVKNGDATALAEMLNDLFSTGQGNNRGGGDNSEITGLRVEVDERTNSILAAGTIDDLVAVEAILLSLDSADARQRQNQVYRLKNKRAEDIALALQQWLRAERDVQGTAPGTVSPFQQIEREVVVVPEIASNSLIVSATPKFYKDIARLIEQLDSEEPMVMIQVLIAEIELGDIDEFGVELGLQDSILFDRSLLGDLLTTMDTTITNDAAGGSTTFTQEVVQSATNTPGFNFGDPSIPLGNAGSDAALATAASLATQGLSSFGVNRVSSEAGFGGFVLSASSNSVSVLLRALQESRRTEVLSRPQIMALNNQPGRVFVGQVVPFITGVTPSQVIGQAPITQVDRINVGLELLVTPRISPEGLVNMTVEASNDRLGPVSEGVPIGTAINGDPILQPIVDQIQASTTVSAVSGQTVVLSGLITKQDATLHRRVPLLADLPLLGNLFRFDSSSTVRSELLIILTPHVVRNRFESEVLKQVESARMNWCLADVVDLHGPAGLRSQTDAEGAAEAEAIFPNQVPGAELLPPVGLPEEIVPTPQQGLPEGLSPSLSTP